MTKLTCGRRRNSTKDNSGVVPKRFSWLAVCVVVLSLSAAGLGQELAATLTGTVTDSSGAVVGGCDCRCSQRRNRRGRPLSQHQQQRQFQYYEPPCRALYGDGQEQRV